MNRISTVSGPAVEFAKRTVHCCLISADMTFYVGILLPSGIFISYIPRLACEKGSIVLGYIGL
jgi:hypothetical protein